MPSIRNHIQLYRNPSAVTFSNPSELMDGEIAVGLKPGHEKLFLKNSQGEIARFASDSALQSLRQAVGIATDGNDGFTYNTLISYLSGNTNMIDALDDVAARARYITPSIETNFKVEMVTETNNDVTVTQPKYSFNIECDVDEVSVTKYIGSNPTVLYEGTAKTFTSGTTMEATEEKYVLEFVPSTVPNIRVQEILYAYLCCTTATSEQTINGNSTTSLNVFITTENEIDTEVTTSSGDYIWFMIPSTTNLKEVTSEDIDIVVDNTNTSVLEAQIGSLTCYRTSNPLRVNEWKPKIQLTDVKKKKRRIITTNESVAGNVIETKYAYGIQWDKENTSPDCIRIGNMELHKSLPVQSQMRGCLLNDNGEVVQYLSNADWQNPSLLDGSQGQVMVEIPEFYWKFSESGNTQSVMLSTVPIGGYKKVGKRFVSAYEATVDTYGGTNRLASVKSMETRYRGCNNSSANDNTYKTGLGRPRTSMQLGTYRTYARNRKSGSNEWNCYDYLTHKVLFWLYAVEFATRYSQKTINSGTTVGGYRIGGLGAGVTNADWNKWTSFNGNYPFVPCGTSDSLGNGSGQVQYVSYSGENASWVTVQVPRYRGIENPFGHIWKMVDGVKVVVEPGGTTSGESKVYVCYNPSQYNSTAGNTANYTYVGNEPRSNDWVKEVVFGEGGDIFCKSNEGVNATSYFTDQHYTSANPSSVETRLVLFGGSAHLGTFAGFVCSYSSYGLSHATAHCGSRLLFIPDAM